MPGSAEPGPAAISGAETSVIYLPVPVAIAGLQKAVRSFLCLVPRSARLYFGGLIRSLSNAGWGIMGRE